MLLSCCENVQKHAKLVGDKISGSSSFSNFRGSESKDSITSYMSHRRNTPLPRASFCWRNRKRTHCVVNVVMTGRKRRWAHDPLRGDLIIEYQRLHATLRGADKPVSCSAQRRLLPRIRWNRCRTSIQDVVGGVDVHLECVV